MFKNKFLKRVITIVFLVIHTTEILASALILDPNSKHNAKLDKSETGIPIVNISTPNNRGISVNEFLEYNVGKEGQVLNNADNVGRSHLAGLINSNPNLGAHQAANLIVLQVNGSNRSQIEGYLEALSRQKVNVILSNENGIYLNNSGTINIKNFTATTGKVKLKDGDFIGIDVEKGNIAIGPKGMDLTKADYVELLSKTLELTGNLVAEKDVKIVTGSNKFDKDGNFEKIESNTPASIAIDASNLGGMYANTIKIISTDKGAGVNSNAFIVSKNNKLEITADGKVKVNKIQGKGIDVKAKDYEQTELAHSDLDINIKADSIKLSGSGTQAEQKIILDGNVDNNSAIYTKENLYTKDLKNTSDIQVLKDIQVDGKLVSSGDIQANDKLLIASSADNTGNISTGSTFTAKDTKTKGKLIAKDSIDVKNLTNEGTIATEAKLNIDGNLKSSGEIKAIGNIQVASNAENTGDILTDGSFSAKDTKTTKKLLAKDQITVANLENSGELGTNSSLTVDGKLENKGKIQAVDKIDVSSSAKNEGEILTNSTFTAKDVNTSNKLIALGDVSTSN
ncbi:MAG: filamentous hemagglutinin N-terminal domain-containing protein, partial [Fusobacterium gastrosuis]|uniref:filamentous hemagglutinin N-terminal domain-containing protein n=1 Tax=Fusobacterium gastrosuis TaxID=1755100 RepID=UPI002A9FE24C|nr:filamentous hemagglutinin N-terminal domain-containing protein [Fusobacterium gastrosuis]